MIIDLSNVIRASGEKIFLSEKLDISGNSDVDTFAFAEPVNIEAFIQNIGDTIEFCANVSAVLKVTCDRCGKPFNRTVKFDIYETLRKEDNLELSTEDNPDIIFFKGTSVDIDDIIFSNLIINLPMKNLCSEDCRGLCLKCGIDLNNSQCECLDDDIDPRLSILNEF